MTELSIILVKVTLVLLAGLVASVALRKVNPVLESILWRFVFAAILLLPLVSAQFNWIVIPVKPKAPISVVQPPASGTVVSINNPTVSTVRIEEPPAATSAGKTHRSQFSLFPLLATIYFIGLAVGAIRLANSIRLRNRVKRDALPMELDQDWQTSVEHASELLDFRSTVELRVHGQAPTPMGWGIRKATIILPTGATQWSETYREYVLLHELTHLHRFDTLFRFLTEISSIIFWFHPFIYLAKHRFHFAEERATDEQVLRLSSPGNGSDYAELLLRFASKNAAKTTRPFSAVSAGMARSNSVSQRIEAILGGQRPPQLSIRSGIALVLVATMLTGLVSGTQFLVAQVNPSPEFGNPETSPERADDDTSLYTFTYFVDPVTWQRILADNVDGQLERRSALKVLWPNSDPPSGTSAIYNPGGNRLVIRSTMTECKRIEALLQSPVVIIRTQISIYQIPAKMANKLAKTYPEGANASAGVEAIHEQIREGNPDFNLLHVSTTNQYNDNKTVKTAIRFRNLTITDTHVDSPSLNAPLNFSLKNRSSAFD